MFAYALWSAATASSDDDDEEEVSSTAKREANSILQKARHDQSAYKRDLLIANRTMQSLISLDVLDSNYIPLPDPSEAFDKFQAAFQRLKVGCPCQVKLSNITEERALKNATRPSELAYERAMREQAAHNAIISVYNQLVERRVTDSRSGSIPTRLNCVFLDAIDNQTTQAFNSYQAAFNELKKACVC